MKQPISRMLNSKVNVMLLVTGVFFSTFGFAGSPIYLDVKDDGNLYYSLERVQFLSERSKKDLTSGLSTQVAILGQLTDARGTIVHAQISSIVSKYDLWDEAFSFVSDGSQRIYKSQQDVVVAIEAPGPFKFISMSKLKSGMGYRLEVVETVNPLVREKFEAIQRWVLGQKISIRATGFGTVAAVSEPTPETPFYFLFRSLWSRAKKGELFVGEVRRTAVSDVFYIDQLMQNKKKKADSR